MHFYRVMVAGMVVVIGLCGVVSAQTAETTGTENTAAEPSETEAASAPMAAPVQESTVTALNTTQTKRLVDLDNKPLRLFSNQDLSEYMSLRKTDRTARGITAKPVDELIQFAMKANGQPYRLYAGYFDWSESDCVTYVNRCIAFSLSHDWDSYYRISERLRHKDGVVDYKNRNFSTLGDWLNNNSWILKDISGDLGSSGTKPAQPFTYYLRPKLFKEVPTDKGTRWAFVGSDYKSGVKEERTSLYIPRDQLSGVLKDLRSGDIFLVIRSVPKNPGCDHMGLIMVNKDGSVDVLHCAPTHVYREPFKTFMQRCSWVNGMKFLRIRDDASQTVETELSRLRSSIQVQEPSNRDNYVQAIRAARNSAPSQSKP